MSSFLSLTLNSVENLAFYKHKTYDNFLNVLTPSPFARDESGVKALFLRNLQISTNIYVCYSYTNGIQDTDSFSRQLRFEHFILQGHFKYYYFLLHFYGCLVPIVTKQSVLFHFHILLYNLVDLKAHILYLCDILLKPQKSVLS